MKKENLWTPITNLKGFIFRFICLDQSYCESNNYRKQSLTCRFTCSIIWRDCTSSWMKAIVISCHNNVLLVEILSINEKNGKYYIYSIYYYCDYIPNKIKFEKGNCEKKYQLKSNAFSYAVKVCALESTILSELSKLKIESFVAEFLIKFITTQY